MEEIKNYYEILKVITKEKEPETKEEKEALPPEEQKERKKPKKSERQIFYVPK
jgi:hypothetical protein